VHDIVRLTCSINLDPSVRLRSACNRSEKRLVSTCHRLVLIPVEKGEVVEPYASLNY
jgi:hypothetical protein